MQRITRAAAILGLTLGLALTLLSPQARAKGRGKGKGRQDRPKEVEVLKKGRIRVVRGMRAEPQITDQTGDKHLCVGPLRDELLRLHGHKLRAWGTVDGKKLMTPTFRVTRYEITDSGGRKPLVGRLRHPDKKIFMLERREGNLEIKAGASFRRILRRRVGCKVWIVGELEGTALKAFKFGWIHCKPPKVIKPRKETTK